MDTHLDKWTTLDELEKLIVIWGNDKGILDQSTPEQQFRKTLEEVMEIAVALRTGDHEELQDGIGDTVVTLILLAKLADTDLLTCLQKAYSVISKRTGVMVDGIFVKDA